MTNKVFTLCPVELPLHSVSAISFFSTFRIIVFVTHGLQILTFKWPTVNQKQKLIFNSALYQT